MFIIRLLSRLSTPALYRVSWILYILTYYVFGYRKKVVLENLKNSFPDKSEKELKAIRKEFYKRFNYHNVETVKVLTITEEELLKRVRFVKCDEILNDIKNGISHVVLASHQFNWEWGLLASKLYLGHEIDAVYQKVKNPRFEALMREIRSTFGVVPIEKDNVMRIVRDTGKIRSVAVVADQAPPKKLKSTYWANFMNQDTAFFPSAQDLPKLTKYPTYFFHMRFIEKGQYELEVKRIAEPPYERGSTAVIDQYIKETEKLIHEDPAGWLWSHRRWKRKREQV